MTAHFLEQKKSGNKQQNEAPFVVVGGTKVFFRSPTDKIGAKSRILTGNNNLPDFDVNETGLKHWQMEEGVIGDEDGYGKDEETEEEEKFNLFADVGRFRQDDVHIYGRHDIYDHVLGIRTTNARREIDERNAIDVVDHG